METRASYILVGSFVLGLIAAAFAFVVWLASVQFEEVPMRYVIYFEGGVSGLSVASPVRYRGVPVGSVSDIRIDPENIERIRVMVEISAETPIKADTEATLTLQGITGVSFVFLSGGTVVTAAQDKVSLAAADLIAVPEPSAALSLVAGATLLGGLQTHRRIRVRA